MQGHSSSVGTMPENMSFDHGSTSDTGIDSQMPWNSIQTSAENWQPVYRIPSSPTNVQSLHNPGHAGLTRDRYLGETSSSTAQSQHHHIESRKEHAWSVQSQATLTMEESWFEPSNNVDVDENGNETANGSSLLQVSGPGNLPPDLNLHSEFGKHENTRLSIGSSDDQVPAAGSSSESLGMPCEVGGYTAEARVDRPGCSFDGQRVSCKRKALEIHGGQSSGAGSSSSFQHAERSQRLAVPAAAQITPRPSRNGVSIEIGNDLANNNESEQVNPRLRLGDGRAVSASPFFLTRRVTTVSDRDSIISADAGNADASTSQHASGLVPSSRLLDMNPAACLENGSSHGPSVVFTVPSGQRDPQYRWGGASSSRTNSSLALTDSRERDSVLFEESASRNISRNISEHPVSVPASEAGNSQQPNWIFSGGSNTVAANAAPVSGAGFFSARIDSSSSTWSHWGRPQYTRRISDIVRRSLLSSSGGQTSSHAAQTSSSAATSQGIAISSGLANQAPHLSNSRSRLLQRHLDSDFRMPYLIRNLAAAGEGRSSIMSEHIRRVLDLMRRGEGLRFEDMMMLDHPAFVGMADIHDQHRDMRLDVDNMSYEELLALEERIGNVCTGLNEETIMTHLKQKKHMDGRADEDPADTEPCTICREEYTNGEDLGTLECGHDFHTDCIKQWLMQKNLCPVCKTTGVTT